MKKMITLGPKGTYSEIAAFDLIKKNNLKVELLFEPSIDFCFENFKDIDYLVLPIENSIDGYVQRTLDLLYLNSDSFIIDEVKLPISFSLVSNEINLDNVDTVYAQFKARNQCLTFFHKYKHLKFITTNSNTESLNLYLDNSHKTAALIPNHLINTNHNLIINNVADETLNQTRFILIGKRKNSYKLDNKEKAIIVLSPTIDKPGLLYNLLAYFADLNINLSSIISRPKSKEIGTYHFFLELNIKMSSFKMLMKTLNKNSDLNISLLGVY